MPAGQDMAFEEVYRGRRVLVTGHTGFTGGWLCLWLEKLGADIAGIGLAPNTNPSLFEKAGIGASVTSHIGDISRFDGVDDVFRKQMPEIVFHLAAQPLVSRAFDDPLETFASNVMGTAHVLEAARRTSSVKAVVCVTTDKVYADQDWHWGYRENDRLGGKDPYSASKAAAELVALTYQKSLAARGNGVAIATARGGNIIGGGDWADNRIVPDFVRAMENGAPLVLRNPQAVRPWQHVLALAHGYLVLGAQLLRDKTAADAWNFGPLGQQAKTVGDLVEGLSAAWVRPDLRYEKGGFPETRFLHVDSTKSRAELHWTPPTDFERTVRLTAEWYRDFQKGVNARTLCEDQIAWYRGAIGALP